MKLLIFTQHYWPEVFRINDVAAALVEAGVDTAVLTGKPNYPVGSILPGYRAWGTLRESYQGVTIHRVPLLPRGRATSLRLAANYLSFIVSAAVLGPWLLRRQRFDAILVYATSPLLQALAAVVLKWCTRSALVIWVQDLWPESLSATGHVRSPHVLGLVRYVVRWIYRRCELILVPSQAFVGRVQPLAGGTPVAFQPNPAERPRARSMDDPFSSMITPGAFTVVFAGNLGTAQALDTVLAAAERLRNHSAIRFLLVGSGSRAHWVEVETRRLGLTNVTLAGQHPPEAMPALFARASALLVSLADHDILALTIPSKIPTYLAAGRPVIASLNGEGARVIAESGAGVCSPASDADALAAAVEDLSRRPSDDLDAMGRRGREYFQRHFEPRHLTDQLLRHLQRAVAR
ncbi:MAG TPA: glycosyltransferase family 4 protein [Verrucomicrobiae bacterium]|nr:glycosyltransferase family 4 protein [Verrucomicrobiae bacterium]